MLFHSDSLSADRWKSLKFLKVFRDLVAVDLTREEAWELAVFLNTAGFLPEHFEALFDWTPKSLIQRNIVLEYWNKVPSVSKAATENVETITQIDGLAWLKAVLEVRPRYRGTVPLWTQLALQGAYSDGLTETGLANAMGGLPGVSAERDAAKVYHRWRTQVVFDQLSGMPLV